MEKTDHNGVEYKEHMYINLQGQKAQGQHACMRKSTQARIHIESATISVIYLSDVYNLLKLLMIVRKLEFHYNGKKLKLMNDSPNQRFLLVP